MIGIHRPYHRRLLVVSFILAIGLIRPEVAMAQATDYIGWVLQKRGDILLFRGDDLVRVGTGGQVFEGDRIVTGAESLLRLQLADRTVLTLGPNSEARLEGFALAPNGDRQQARVGLEGGIVRAALGAGPQRGPFEIVTAYAITSAAGTDWIVELRPDHVLVLVNSGLVSVAGPGGAHSVIVDAGFGTAVRPGEGPRLPTRWTDNRAEELRRQVR